MGAVAATGIRIPGAVISASRIRQWMPHAVHPPIESGILLASITAVLLNVFFDGTSRDTSAAVDAARQAEAH
ncbi:nucleobase:cation symporter-2, NCS2 family [Paracidovorax citrulli]|nr:nucleobase:cation symporter-2, NCS2 family [Paracidovorax citrulli]